MEENTRTPETAAEEQRAGEQEHQNNEDVRKYTKEEVNDIVQKRLARERDRMAKLFQDEKQTSDLDERERNILKRELKADTVEKLAEKGLPPSLAKLMNYESAEKCEESFEEVCTIFNSSLNEALKGRARQETPKEGCSFGRPDPLKEAFQIKR